MKFLHVSDIHFNPAADGRATRDLRAKFKRYTMEKGLQDIDEVFFTGDFRHAIKQAHQNPFEVAQNAVNFLCDIAECVGVTDLNHIHIVPGNHDLDREQNKEENSSFLDEIYRQYDPDDGCFAGYIKGNVASLEYLRGRFGFFEKCAELLHNQIWSEFRSGQIHRCRSFEDYNIIYLNTAIASGRDSDRHNLLIGTDDLEKTLQHSQGKPLIILAHNPLSHLAYEEQNIVKNLLKDSGSPTIWFCGDVHDTRYDKNYNIACLSVGCMIKQRGAEASFFVGEIAKHRGVSISAHCYVSKHGHWQPEEALTRRVTESLPDDLKPPPAGIIPKENNLPERNYYFTGREEQLQAIATAFRKSRTVIVKQTISGLGGVGKTQLVREFAYRYGASYKNGIFEINADSTATVYAGFVELSKIFHIDLPEDFKEEDLRRAIRSWLTNTDQWLLIIDNLDNEDTISPYIPNNNICGHILVTTRNSNMAVAQQIDLSVFNLDEAISFLDKRLAGCDHLEKDGEELKKELCNRLGCLPLALEQAAAYIKVTRTSFLRYLDLLDESGLEAFEIDGDGYNKPENYAKSVTTTWEISFNTIALEGAKQLFFLCVYLASDRIPVKLFSQGREILPEPVRSNLATILQSNRILTELRRYSLTTGDSEHISIHRLVQEVTRNKIRPDTQWMLYDLQLLYNCFSFEYGNVASHEQFLLYIPHVETFANMSKEQLTGESEQELLALLYGVGGRGYDYLGQYQKAIKWNKDALDIRKRILGETHYMTAVSYNNLASAYQAAGNYTKALDLYKFALKNFCKELGPDHATVASAYSNIAGIYDCQGEFDRALEYYQKALDIRLEIYGEKHSETAVIYNNIAYVYARKAHYWEALENHAKVLEIRKAEVGEKHVLTATSYSNIAYIYTCLGDFTKALEMQYMALDIREVVLGVNHPETLATYMNIAFIRSETGNYDEALKIYNNIIPIYENTRGQHHLDTAAAYCNIAGTYYTIGDYLTALKYYNLALNIRKQVLGTDHPDTATLYGNIAAVYADQGSYDMALEKYEDALAIWKKCFGENHPNTAEAYNSIATIYDTKGNEDKALELYKKALDIREKVLGKEHLDTAISYNNVAAAIDARGKHIQAMELYQRVLTIRKKLLGEEHPETAAVYNNIAAVYGELGESDNALDNYQKALGIYKKVFGEEHPDIATVYNNIGTIFDSRRDYLTAIKWMQIGLGIREKLLGSHHLDTADSYINVAAVLESLRQLPEALTFYKKAFPVFKTELGEDSIYTIYVRKKIEELENKISQ